MTTRSPFIRVHALMHARMHAPVLTPLLILVLAAAPLTGLSSVPAVATVRADDPVRAPQGNIIGRAVDTRGSGVPRARVVLFDQTWNYLREVRARGTGRFALAGLDQGTYRLQVTDGRPAWRTNLVALTDSVVRVRRDSTTVTTVRMKPGAFLTGRVTRGPKGRAAGRALVRASDESGHHFEVRADARGGFALGGLPPGNYRVSAYDKAGQWVGSPAVVRGLSRRKGQHLRIRLRQRAGGLNGYVLDGSDMAGHILWVTAVHRRTGQWWTARVRNGDLSFRGLAPGRYTLKVQGTDKYAARTVRPAWKVRPGRTRQITLRVKPAAGRK